MTRRVDQARMTIDIDKETHKALKYKAVQEGKSLRAVVLDAIDKTCTKNEPTNNVEAIEQ